MALSLIRVAMWPNSITYWVARWPNDMGCNVAKWNHSYEWQWCYSVSHLMGEGGSITNQSWLDMNFNHGTLYLPHYSHYHSVPPIPHAGSRCWAGRAVSAPHTPASTPPPAWDHLEWGQSTAAELPLHGLEKKRIDRRCYMYVVPNRKCMTPAEHQHSFTSNYWTM